jgi:hypothetical protein
LLAWPWARFGYTHSHLERQGRDVVHHLIIAHQLTVPDGRTEQALGGHVNYPIASHRLTVWAAPLFGGHLLMAMRYVSAATMLALFLLPAAFFCRAFRPLPALLLLLAWHLACYLLKVDGLNHFLWEGQYNYSRAVGTVAFWVALIVLSFPAATARARLAHQGLVIACACFALACHIAPGAVTFGALLAWQAARWALDRRWEYLLGALAALAAAAAMYFGTDVWAYMSRNAGSDGSLPVVWLPCVLVWVPALLVGVGLFLRRPGPGEGADLETPLLAGLLASGALQGYLTFQMLSAGSCAPYAVKSIFFFTFPLASLLLALWGGQLSRRLAWPPVAKVPAWATAALAVALLTLLVAHALRKDYSLRRDIRARTNHPRARPRKEALPHEASQRLKALRSTCPGCYYHDPRQPSGSFYATVVGLGLRRAVADECVNLLLREGWELSPAVLEEMAQAGVSAVLLPDDLSPAAEAPGLGPAVKVGRFWKCPLSPPRRFEALRDRASNR